MPGSFYLLFKMSSEALLSQYRRVLDDISKGLDVINSRGSLSESSLGEQFFLDIFRDITPKSWTASRQVQHPLAFGYQLFSRLKEI